MSLGYRALTATGRVAAGEVDTIFAPRTPRVDTCGVILCHGSGAPRGFMDPTAQPSSVKLAAALATAGIPCIAGDFGGQAWGSPTEQADITKAWQVLQGLYPSMRTDKVAVLGASMGGAAASIWAQQNPDKTACMVGLIPLLDLFDFFYRNVNGSQAEIVDAWGPNLVAAGMGDGTAYNTDTNRLLGIRNVFWPGRGTYSLETGSGISGGPDGFYRYAANGTYAGGVYYGFQVSSGTGATDGGNGYPVTPGQIYTVSFWLRSTVTGGSSTRRVYYNFYDSSGNQVSGQGSIDLGVAGDHNWHQLSATLPTPPTGSAYMGLTLLELETNGLVSGDTLDLTGLDVRVLPTEANNAANAHLAADVPLLVGYSTADQTVLPAYITNYMAQMTNPDSQAIITDTTVGHSDAAIGGMPIPTIGQFLVAHGC